MPSIIISGDPADFAIPIVTNGSTKTVQRNVETPVTDGELAGLRNSGYSHLISIVDGDTADEALAPAGDGSDAGGGGGAGAGSGAAADTRTDEEKAEDERRAALTDDERDAEDAAKEAARRDALTDEERAAEDAALEVALPEGFLDRSVALIVADLPGLNDDQVRHALADEEAGKTRKSLIAAIAERLTPPPPTA